MPRPSNTEERRAQIVKGLRRVLAKEGYERASIGDIAKAAGLTQGLVHYHFKNKLEILETLVAELLAARNALLERKLSAAKDPWQRLDAFVDHHLHPGKDADPEALACWIVISAEALREPRIQRAFALWFHESMSRVETLLREGTKARVFKKVDYGATAAALLALIQGYYTVAAAAPGAIPKGSAHVEAKRMLRGISAMSFEVIALGVGDTFSRVHHTTSLLVHKDGFYLGIDCPDTYRNVLRDAGERCGRELDLFAVDDILLTHVHGDHMNGLEGVGFFKHFAEKKRLKLHTTEDVRSVIWDHRLKAPMETLWNGQTYRTLSFEDYFDYRKLAWSGASTIGPFTVELRRTKHHVPTCAVRITDGDATLGYSSDTAFDPELIAWLSNADLVIHETNYGPAHTAYADLAALPEATRAKMRLIHYPDQLTESVIPLVREGEIIFVQKF